MRIGIQTWGSNGDIRPMIAFGGQLANRGHNVTISIFSVDDKDYSELCNKNGINYIKLPKNNYSNFKGLKRLFGNKKSSIDLLNILLKKLLFPFVDEIYKTSCELAENNDVLIGHLLMFPLKVSAKKYNKKYISIVYWPGYLKTKYKAPYPLKSNNILINSLLWKLVDNIFNILLSKEINKLYKKELNTKVKSALNDGCLSDSLNIIPASSHIWNEFSDWNNRNKIIGSWEIDIGSDIEYKYYKKIEEFVSNKKKNVFISLGSSQQTDSAKAMKLMVETAKQLDVNIFLQTTEEKYKKDTIEDNIYFFDSIPHGVILKYCCVAIHHGGAGTTQTVIKYGVPAIVIGFADEQMSWGERIYELGLGEKPIKYKKATKNEIIKRVNKIMSNEKYKNNAEIYAEKLKNENGLVNSVKIIEKYYEKNYDKNTFLI